MEKGYWNGEYSATFKAVLYRIERADTPTWWQNRLVGTERQGILITYAGETWLIDNEHGDGYFKVTLGLGSPGVSHKSVGSYTIVRDLPEREWKRSVDREAIAKEDQEHDKWMEENFPASYQKIQALRTSIRAHREKYKL